MRTQDERSRELIAEQAAAWYVEHRADTLSGEARREFLRWLRTSPLHIAEYLQIAGIARDAGALARQSDLPLDELLALAKADTSVVPLDRPDAPGAPQSRHAVPPRARRTLRRVVAWGAAVAATVLLVIAGGVFWLSTGPQEFATRHGEQRTWQLPDSTVVRLNSDSAVAVHFDATRRHVEVTRGQVFFEVAEDAAGRPFHVRAGPSLIEDIGTAFDVYRQETATTITVVEGRVRVWEHTAPSPPKKTRTATPATPADPVPAPPPQPLADLSAGTQVRIANSGQVAAKGPADVRKATAWVREEILFEAEPIAAVAAEFNRYNQLQIRIDDPHVGAMPISGVFRSYDVQSFVDFLNGLPGVRAETAGGRIIVTRAPAADSASG